MELSSLRIPNAPDDFTVKQKVRWDELIRVFDILNGQLNEILTNQEKRIKTLETP